MTDRAPEMAALVAAKDWSKTALGPAESWPASLTLTVQLMLASGFPKALRWGPDFVMLYNDGYRAILGDKHPAALGVAFAVTWPEVQPQLGPLHQAILAGESLAQFSEDLPLRIQRRAGVWEDGRFTVSYSPVPDATAPTGVGGVLITVVETTNRVHTENALRRSEAALRESEAALRLVLDSATDAIYCIDTEGTTTRCNAAFLRMLGMRDESDAIGHKLHGVIHHSHPDGSPYAREDCPIYNTARGGPPAHLDEECFFRLDGTSFPVEYWVAPIMRDGVLQGAVCTFIDITERKRAQERQALLVRELNHRVKNVFAITAGMVSLSARTATSPKDLSIAIRGRLEALASAHDLILPHAAGQTGASVQATSLDDLLRKILSPYAVGGADRVVCVGPPVPVGAQAASSLALILHELATNAAKYGALSAPAGHLRVDWTTSGETLTLTWEERGGPALAAPPTARGFGTVLLEQSVRGQFNGAIDYDWNKAGLIVRLSLPLPRLQD
jgi:PAS domain S-box-containing protein